jgi:class 3 adenylate cyclase
MSESQRKSAAIMFTDIVGYTTLMGKDETETMNLLRKYQGIQKSMIENYHGVYIKEIGDGLLAYFERSEDAVLCSIEIQKKLRDISHASIRIGLHWAEIIKEKGDIYGDGVNITSRIEALADPGGIYVSEAVKNSLKNGDQFDIKYLGSAKLKNVRKQVIVHAIQGEGLPAPSRYLISN